MAADQLPIADTEEKLDAVITEYLEAVERGGSSEPGLWLQRYPEIATELELFFAAETRFDRMVAPLRSAAVGSTMPADTTAPNDQFVQSDQPLKTIKDYDLLMEIGRGGMGVIYKARQRSLNRLVAVKMIRSAEWATPAERMRFRWEAEAIAALDHPNIVPIYEIGEIPSDDGAQLPFFSMKLIEGDNLAQGRDRFRSNWKAIARLLLVVARAVEHAHQRGILHRDLKPANILLGCSTDASANDERAHGYALIVGTTNITPHISDFGLAARAQQHHGQTHAGTIVGTPSYLAPELAAGQATATIASDVYALGAILYEMLTGEPPFRADTPLETIRMLTTSSVKAPRKVNSTIPIDLETICLKCLQPNPQQRYESAGNLADDLELFLAGRSISARPVGSFTAFRRWCWRQPVIAGLGAALLLLMAVSLPLIAWNWHRAVEHERIAEIRLEETLRERERADEGFHLAHSAFEDLFRMIGDYRTEELSSSETLNKELLEGGLKYYRDFVDRRQDDPNMRRELASAMFRIAAITQRIKTQRETLIAYDKTIDFLRSSLDQYPNDVSLMEILSRSLTNRGKTLGQLDRIDEAIRSHDEAVEVWSRLPDGGAGVAAAQRGLGIAMMDRGLAYQHNGDWSQALESYIRAKNTLLNCSEPGRVQSPLVHCFLNIAEAQGHFNHLDLAQQNAREGKQIAEKLFKQFPNAEEAQLLMGQSQHTTAKIELKANNLTGAKASLLSAQQFYEGLRRAKPRMTQYKRLLATVFGDLSTVEKQQKRPAESLKAEEQAVFLLRELVELDGESRTDRVLLGHAASRLGSAYMETKNYTAAAKAYEESRTQRRFLVGRRPSSTEWRSELGRTCFVLGVCFDNMKKYKEALAATDEAIEHIQVVLQQNDADTHSRKTLSSALGNRAIMLRSLSRSADAIAATEERMKLWPKGANELYDTALDLARSYNSLSEKAESNADLKSRAVKSAINALQQALGAGLPNLDQVRTEPIFAKIRETSEFKTLLNGN
jgi:tetratricopeptide (TPR) repeat protein